uniref:Mitochondrial carrier protein n=1 Tax=Strongyloides venezuelensis TaxID=75913 RepID=A0A0K0FL65_STRVS
MASTSESKFDKPLIIDFIAGSAAGVGMCLSGHPLDTIKVHIQSAPASAKTGIFSCTRDIIRAFGPMGLYRGVLSPLSSTPLINATVFAGESFCSRFIKKDLNPVISTFMSGFCAGAFQTVVLCPTDVVKLKMQLTNTNLNTVCLTKNIIETSGVRSLFRGFWITLIRDAPAYGVYFSSFEYFTSRYLDFSVEPGNGYNLLVNFISGGLAGILCWIVTYPLDIVKTRFQNVTSYKNYSTVYKELYKENGLKGFFRGINSTIIRAFITNAVTFVIMTQCQYYLTQIYNQERKNTMPNLEKIIYTTLPGDYHSNKKCCCSSPRRCLQCFHMDLFHLPEAGTTFLEPMLHTHSRL